MLQTASDYRRRYTAKCSQLRVPNPREKKTLADAFHDELQDLYSAEKQLTKAIPAMAKKASCAKLTKAFQDHLEQTKMHVSAWRRRFAVPGKPAGQDLRGDERAHC